MGWWSITDVSSNMPNIFTKDGFRFFFYSNDHSPVHVHVRRGSGEAIFEVADEVTLREAVGMKTKELQQAEALACEHQQLIIQKWYEHFD